MNNTMTSLKTLLPNWALIQIEGPDSGAFLQNLLTNDVLKMDVNSSKLAGFCTPKGRLLASFWITRSESNFYNLWISKDIANEFIQKLKLFRLRSKVEINLVSDSLYIVGEVNDKPFIALEDLSCELNPGSYQNTLYFRRLSLIKENDVGLDNSLWNLLEVLSGVPRITAATKDLFVPQMINFESVGGVDFKKGCYPGQEVVARSQYLGTIKRRLKLGIFESNHHDLMISPGVEVFMEGEEDQPCGVVVLSSYDSIQKKYYLQLELNNKALDSEVHFSKLDSKLSGSIIIQEPPYSLMIV